MSDCCHYDEGYDVGFEAGEKSSSGDTSVHIELLEAVARHYDRMGWMDRSEVLRETASYIASWDLDRIVEKERERVAELVKLYAETKAA